jgi:transposase
MHGLSPKLWVIKPFTLRRLTVHLENIVKRTLEIKDHRIVNIEDHGENIVINLEVKKRRKLPCSRCGRRAKLYDKTKIREWIHVPLWGISVFIRYIPRRVQCPECGIRVEKYPWAEGKSPLTTAQINILARWCQLLPIETVANMYGLHWNVVYAAVNRAVAYGLERREISGVLYIGIDELSRKRGQRYLTNVYDLEKKILLWSGKDRTEETLRAFFRQCSKDVLANIKGVCCDMWAPYEHVVREFVPHAIFVFDRFHIVQHLSKAIDKVRAEENRELLKEKSPLLEKSRYIFLKNPENLTEKQEIRLSELIKINLKTIRCYLLKEEFRGLWECRTKEEAASFIKSWFWRATHSRLKPLRDFAWRVKRHIDGILAWFDLPLSNGVVEALNNTAKTISHRSHGFRVHTTFSTLMLLCMGGLQLPETNHRFL